MKSVINHDLSRKKDAPQKSRTLLTRNTPDSDIDILYTFQPGKATLTNLSGLHDHLEHLFGRKIDLVSRKWLNPILRPVIEQDAIICTAGAEAAGARPAPIIITNTL